MVCAMYFLMKASHEDEAVADDSAAVEDIVTRGATRRGVEDTQLARRVHDSACRTRSHSVL